ncbi:MAG: hypothetical protein COX34_00520 [Candidatus Nealsonbacteria bacterium CG23_combo_of_CG06-09_8_20_14_all_36_12]|uniref:Uncharacterized protein n=2 Tax=Candidatus Nealsoniibacteriota TaxID=1817911 RepID=A0A2H0TL25_9BACT|nr:MAG: hypothetical protein COX34_00520 [Candidatus Nealsonbacteria bacterium CG23_combo_of_CG06-09_8_20_14_all_36_12]PIR72853.1 MAG: hypothetical protein COV26_01555 [Candidatus Nealsonbacteria bacterium CG10_big_fil_rev_8_21_14_0_10_36_23]
MFNKIKRYLKKKKESRDFGNLLGKWCKLRFKNIHIIKEGDVEEFEKTKKEINYDEVIFFFDKNDNLQTILARGKEWSQEEIKKDVQRLVEIEKQRK